MYARPSLGALGEKNRATRERILSLSYAALGPLRDSRYLRPVRVGYVQDGREMVRDLVRACDSVVVLIFNKSRGKLVFVRQFRPASYCACLPMSSGPAAQVDLKIYPPTLGLTLELCCGAVDKPKPLVEIARDEVREECGYEAPASAFSRILGYKFTGPISSNETLFYVEVTDEMNIHNGGGEESENELIEIIEMSIDEVNNYITSDEVESPESLLYAVSWFLMNKRQYCTPEKSRL